MKRTFAALAAAGFLAVMAGPALAGGGCGNWSTHTAGGADGDNRNLSQLEQSTPVPTQTASTTSDAE